MSGCIPADMVDSLKTDSFNPMTQMSFNDSMTFMDQSIKNIKIDKDEEFEQHSAAQTSVVASEAWKHLRNVVAPRSEKSLGGSQQINSLRELDLPENTFFVERPINNNYILVWGCPPGGGLLTDTTTIQGIPWSSLKHLILDPAFNAHVFGSRLSEQEASIL